VARRKGGGPKKLKKSMGCQGNNKSKKTRQTRVDRVPRPEHDGIKCRETNQGRPCKKRRRIPNGGKT